MRVLTKTLFFFFVLFSTLCMSSCSNAAEKSVENETRKEQSTPATLIERQNSDVPPIGWWVK